VHLPATGLAIFVLWALSRHASLVLIGSMSGLHISSLLIVILIAALTTLTVAGAITSYVVATQSWFHTSYQLLEGDGLSFEPSPVTSPIADAATDSFAHHNYRAQTVAGGWVLQYSSQGTGAHDIEVFVPRTH
jgi:hypothetical protein